MLRIIDLYGSFFAFVLLLAAKKEIEILLLKSKTTNYPFFPVARACCRKSAFDAMA
jgi:hypothetical protein